MSTVSVLPRGTRAARLVHALAYSMEHTADGEPSPPLARDYAERWTDTPSVAKSFEGWERKAAVAAGTTVDASFAGPLAVAGVYSEVAELLRDTSLVGALLTRARRAPLNVGVPRETTAPVADWLQEGKPTPVRAGAYATVQLPAYKAVSLTVLTHELATLGGRDAEGLVSRTMVGAFGQFLDRQLLDHTVAASAGVRPASLTFGGTKVTSTGTTSAQITADLGAMAAGITTSQSGLLWIGRPLTFARIALALPGVVESGRLCGIPYLANGNSPQQLTLLDVGEVLIALPDDGFDVRVSRHASVQLDDSPTDPVTAATVFQSLWMRNLISIRVSGLASWWAPAGAVSSMVTTY